MPARKKIVGFSYMDLGIWYSGKNLEVFLRTLQDPTCVLGNQYKATRGVFTSLLLKLVNVWFIDFSNAGPRWGMDA